MIKVEIKNKASQQITNMNFCVDQSSALAWVAEVSPSGAFGKPQRWLKESEFTTETIAGSIESRVIHGVGEQADVIQYRFEDDFEIIMTDVSNELALKKRVSDRKKKREFGALISDKIAAINEVKQLSNDQVDAFMNNSIVKNLKEHLMAGNIDTFVSRLTAADVSYFFTASEKKSVVDECNSFLNSIQGG